MSDLHNRRMFLRAAAAAGAAWATADLLQVEEALAWSAQKVSHVHTQTHAHAKDQPPPVSVLTKEQANALDAMSSRILPAVDGRPGAHEAGVVMFIDRSLATFNARNKQLYV